MTNPNDAVGTNGAFGGRTSVNAFNDVLGAFQSRGVLSGWGVAPSSGMTVACGGNGTTRDVAIAEDTNGNKTTVNNISGAPISVTLDSAPASNSRYDAIVVYVDKPPTGNATQDNPECCGIIKVTGTAASTPAYPNDGAIRSAITADGASGASAYYAVIGYVLVASGTTTITSGMITAGSLASVGNNQVNSNSVVDGSINVQKIDWASIIGSKIIISGDYYAGNGTTLQTNSWTNIGTFVAPGSGMLIVSGWVQVANGTNALGIRLQRDGSNSTFVSELVPGAGAQSTRVAVSAILKPGAAYTYRLQANPFSGNNPNTADGSFRYIFIADN